jgi:molybdopterin converting factor small subunit
MIASRKSIQITVKIIGHLIYQSGFSESEITLSLPATPRRLLSTLNLTEERAMIITRNGKAIGLDDPVTDVDRIVIAPIYSGG